MNNRKIKLFFFTQIGVCLIILICSLVAMTYVYQTTEENLLNQQMQSSTREGRELGKMLEEEVKLGIPTQKIIANLQASIANTDVQSEFVCMYNTSGLQICHPNPVFIGQKIDVQNSQFYANRNYSSNPFSEILLRNQEIVGKRVFPDQKKRSPEIVAVFPVKGSNWMLAIHVNFDAIDLILAGVKKNLLLIFISMLFLMSLGIGILTYIFNKKYHARLEGEMEDLNKEMQDVLSINQSLIAQHSYAQKKTGESNEKTRKRLITYEKDEMILLESEEIAFCFLEENMVVIQLFSGKKHLVSQTLEELNKQLDEDRFYRANRQYLVNIQAVESIYLYGKNQLKIVTKPQAPDIILISKNKVSEFKKWLEN